MKDYVYTASWYFKYTYKTVLKKKRNFVRVLNLFDQKLEKTIPDTLNSCCVTAD
jgi:hypothetical protein